MLNSTAVVLLSGQELTEWSCLGASDILGNVIGFLTTIIGIFQMQLFRDVNISLRQVRVLLHRPSASLASLDLSSNSATNLVDDFNISPPNGAARHAAYT
ncbi:hypothetical protein Y032_0904g2966 [Ancylostoma ceylanicum]|uniref:Uncharacterized protein n=1 Tax=Ancylostoma ceylanicum TaxID=53326 RepID=A0A016W9R7_9BILA|nr:hypothetical protein Y032_0904g2966 [Ancylostoma ceylanicum]